MTWRAMNPARSVMLTAPERRKKWRRQYTTAIYSDDHGKTWQASEPFPARGTGEAGVAELSDGTIYYNSRRHAGDNPRHRWTARSSDGGETWKDLQMSKILPDGPRHTSYGCFGGLTRLPEAYYDKDFYSKPHCLLNRPLWPWTKMRFWWYRA